MRSNAEKQEVNEWLAVLSDASRGKHYAGLWKRVHSMADVPSRRRCSVNIYKLNRHTKDGDNVIVPGKVLSVGSMDHKINVSAIEFSGQALRALKSANCKIVKISDMVKADRVNVIV